MRAGGLLCPEEQTAILLATGDHVDCREPSAHIHQGDHRHSLSSAVQKKDHSLLGLRAARETQLQVKESFRG